MAQVRTTSSGSDELDTNGGPRPSVLRSLDVCPVEVAMAVLGGAWKLTAVKYLLQRTHRFGDLRRAVGPVTPRVLTRQLRELEADGIVTRTVYAQVPPRVEYSLTDRGRSLEPIVTALDAWGADYQSTVAGARPR
ncbi:transcriptional regulator [Microlunatus sp. Gsoil 973]|nr:transcriptional regulator [Microlunatus sp. Gsoil 973]